MAERESPQQSEIARAILARKSRKRYYRLQNSPLAELAESWEARIVHVEAPVEASYYQVKTPEFPLVTAWVKANIPTEEIQKIEGIAAEVFGSESAGAQWLQQNNPATYDRAPVSLLGSQGGYEHVFELLMRIEHGNLA